MFYRSTDDCLLEEIAKTLILSDCYRLSCHCTSTSTIANCWERTKSDIANPLYCVTVASPSAVGPTFFYYFTRFPYLCSVRLFFNFVWRLTDLGRKSSLNLHKMLSFSALKLILVGKLFAKEHYIYCTISYAYQHYSSIHGMPWNTDCCFYF